MATKTAHVTNRSLWITAYHEAGHAVVAFLLGLRIGCGGITIVPTQVKRGLDSLRSKEMPADENTQRDAGSARTDQIGKVFMVVGQDVRQCFICEGMFTRRASTEHAKVACYPARS